MVIERYGMLNRFWPVIFLVLSLVLLPSGEVLSAGVPANATASTNFSVEVWDTDRGLPQSSVISMVQTRDGYLWLGTLNGLARFDGRRFTVFHEGNTPGLNSSRIVKLFEDSRQRLWVGTESAGITLVANGTATNLNIGTGTRDGRLVSICEDVAGTVWMFLANGQLCCYQSNRVGLLTGAINQPGSTRVLAFEPGRNLLWVGTDASLSALSVPEGGGSALVVAQEVPVRRARLHSLQPGRWLLADGQRANSKMDWRADGSCLRVGPLSLVDRGVYGDVRLRGSRGESHRGDFR